MSNTPYVASSADGIDAGYFLIGVLVDQAASAVRRAAPLLVTSMGPVSMDAYSEGFRAVVKARRIGI